MKKKDKKTADDLIQDKHETWKRRGRDFEALIPGREHGPLTVTSHRRRRLVFLPRRVHGGTWLRLAHPPPPTPPRVTAEQGGHLANPQHGGN
jgi:hypothetical protein